eukprot:1190254-Prorocentrum_minimum.AAC.3
MHMQFVIVTGLTVNKSRKTQWYLSLFHRLYTLRRQPRNDKHPWCSALTSLAGPMVIQLNHPRNPGILWAPLDFV